MCKIQNIKWIELAWVFLKAQSSLLKPFGLNQCERSEYIIRYSLQTIILLLSDKIPLKVPNENLFSYWARGNFSCTERGAIL